MYPRDVTDDRNFKTYLNGKKVILHEQGLEESILNVLVDPWTIYCKSNVTCYYVEG